MEPTFLPASVVTLSDAENFAGLYELFRKKKVVACMASKTGAVSFLMSNGKLIKHTAIESTRVLTSEHAWASLIHSDVECGLIFEDFPCLLYLANSNLLCMTSGAGNIHSVLPKYINTSSVQIKPSFRSLHYSNSSKLFLGLSDSQIQVMGLSSENALISYEPFTTNATGFVCEG